MPHAADNVQVHSDRLDQPLRWRKPRKIFVNSMSDLFHPAVPDAFLDDVFAVMLGAPHHIFQVLTKRPERMHDYLQNPATPDRVALQAWRDAGMADHPVSLRDMKVFLKFSWPLPNVWLGVSVEDQRRAQERIPLLLQTPATLRFLSCEPLLGPVDLTDFQPFHEICYCQEEPNGCKPRFSFGCPEKGIDWVIVGAESGPQARPMDDDWVRSLRDQCQDADVPFFFKAMCKMWLN